jgi:cytochrome c biogenesis protein CcdA
VKKIFLIFILAVVLSFLIKADFSLAQEDNSVCAVYFTGVGCFHCANADPVILEDLPKEYPDLIFIEYEIYQQSENAPLIEKYNQNYNSGLSIPLVIFNKDNYIVGDRPILENVREIIDKLKNNPCSLSDGSFQDFEKLNLATLSGQPKIWRGDRILVKISGEDEWIFGWDGQAAEKQNSTEINPNDILQKLISIENIPGFLSEIKYTSIDGPIGIPLSGKYVNFDNAIDFRVKFGKETTVETELTFFKIVSLAVVDAVNPCALTVLALMLIAILTYNPTKRKDILLAGFAFVFSVFLMYLLYGLIIVKSFQVIQALGAIRLWLYKILGFGAIILGCFKIKDFFQHKAICKISPRVDKIINKITTPKGAFLVGAFVTIFLLPCTIGPYIICGGILSALCTLKAFSWLLFYNLIFVLPMVGVVLIVYLGLSKIEDISGWEARNIKYLDLVSGLIIAGLGIAMILGLV